MSVGRIFRLANDLEVDEEERRVLDQEMREAPGLIFLSGVGGVRLSACAIVAVEEVEAEMDNALSSEQLHPLLQTPTEDWSSLVENPASKPIIPPETPCRPSSGPIGETLLGFDQDEEFEEDLPFDDEDDMPVDDIRGPSPSRSSAHSFTFGSNGRRGNRSGHPGRHYGRRHCRLHLTAGRSGAEDTVVERAAQVCSLSYCQLL